MKADQKMRRMHSSDNEESGTVEILDIELMLEL